ncbi:MAG: hypothetical protein GKC00_08150 [Candidatus Methanofastidiosa archaeon]|nr:hypothetical protein [Candidatus Methanofastidiosa archaeon]
MKKNSEYEKYGFDWRGIHKETGTMYDQRGFDKNGMHRETETKFDPEGYNSEGYDLRGFNRNGIHQITWDVFDLLGMDKDGNKIAPPIEDLSKIVGSRPPKKKEIKRETLLKHKKNKKIPKRKKGQEVIENFI